MNVLKNTKRIFFFNLISIVLNDSSVLNSPSIDWNSNKLIVISGRATRGSAINSKLSGRGPDSVAREAETAPAHQRPRPNECWHVAGTQAARSPEPCGSGDVRAGTPQASQQAADFLIKEPLACRGEALFPAHGFRMSNANIGTDVRSSRQGQTLNALGPHEKPPRVTHVNTCATSGSDRRARGGEPKNLYGST